MRYTKHEVIPFAANLKMLRESKGLTLRELAYELDVGKSSLQQYESAKADPSMTVVRKVAEYFDVDVNWLIGVKKNETAKKFKLISGNL